MRSVKLIKTIGLSVRDMSNNGKDSTKLEPITTILIIVVHYSHVDFLFLV